VRGGAASSSLPTSHSPQPATHRLVSFSLHSLPLVKIKYIKKDFYTFFSSLSGFTRFEYQDFRFILCPVVATLMANPPQDPADPAAPDFTGPEFAAQRNLLSDSGIPVDQTTGIIRNIWLATKAQEREVLLRQQANQEQAQRDREEAEEADKERLRQEEADLLDAARLEDRKKNKAKYNPIRDVLVPSGPIIIPCASAQAKMKKGAYCELWYFSNQGLKAAEKSATSQEDLDYIAVQRDADNARVLVIASTSELPISKPCDKKDEAYKLIADEDLAWEDFLEATPRIVISMRDNDWADDRIQMFIDFWTAIHRHPWCHASDRFSQQALRAYQAQQRRKWHLAAGTSHSWSLAKINQDVLQETRDAIIADAHQRELTALNKVGFTSGLFAPPRSNHG
jgi:hypothetical protein